MCIIINVGMKKNIVGGGALNQESWGGRGNPTPSSSFDSLLKFYEGIMYDEMIFWVFRTWWSIPGNSFNLVTSVACSWWV